MGEYLINAFATLFVTIEPIALAPIFIGLTSGMPEATRRRVAISAAIIAAGVLVGFAFFGGPLMEFLGISLPAFRIAGGLLLFWIAFEMIFDLRAERKAADAQQVEPGDAVATAAFPLAVPMMAGPAAIAATIITAETAPSTSAFAVFIVMIIAIVTLCLIVFLLATRFDVLLRRTGRIIMTRLFGVVLAALAVQFVVDGVKAVIAA